MKPAVVRGVPMVRFRGKSNQGAPISDHFLAAAPDWPGVAGEIIAGLSFFQSQRNPPELAVKSRFSARGGTVISLRWPHLRWHGIGIDSERSPVVSKVHAPKRCFQVCHSLAAEDWQTIATIVPSTNTVTVLDADAPGHQQRFYRLVTQ